MFVANISARTRKIPDVSVPPNSRTLPTASTGLSALGTGRSWRLARATINSSATDMTATTTREYLSLDGMMLAAATPGFAITAAAAADGPLEVTLGAPPCGDSVAAV
jgi:hypothetical protein